MIMDMGKIKQGNVIVPWQVGANLEKMVKKGRVDIILEEDSVIFAKTPSLPLTVLHNPEGAAASTQG